MESDRLEDGDRWSILPGPVPITAPVRILQGGVDADVPWRHALELAHATRAALARAVRVDGVSGTTIDVVGTGGDGRNSFNCSTATSLVLAGMGYKVVKHGGRAVSSKCGSADALEALGIDLDKNPASVAEMVKKRNFAFLFAPHFQ